MPTPAGPSITLDGEPLTIEQVERLARNGARVVIPQETIGRVEASRSVVEKAMAEGRTIYGVNTGFGSLANTRVGAEDLRALQLNLIRSHAACVGDPLPSHTVRAMMGLLCASLCRGHSGVRPVVVETLAAMLNEGVTPIVPATGSVGASGDLAPLAHAVLVALGEGEAELEGMRMLGGDAMQQAGIDPIHLEAKEGLALINGTHLMAARAALALSAIERCLGAAFVATGLAIDAAKATDSFLDPRVHAVRNQPNQAKAAAIIRDLLAGSETLPSHRVDDPRVQDPYSYRCAPVVLGAAMDLIDAARAVVERELGAVTDNPLVFGHDGSEGADVVSAGNFHGMPLAVQLDTMSIALCHVAGIAERRVFQLIAARDPENPLTPYLSPKPGTQSGLMITQYTAAACVNELQSLANPASVSNIPTCAGMEDYNSFGPTSAAQLNRAVDLAHWVIAIEILCCCAALDQHPLKTGRRLEQARRIVRETVPPLTEDRSPSPDIEAIVSLIRAGAFLNLIDHPE
ncbi:MAG: histidine ammonia-lyase [Phycisphaeraceae bacterium]|nr:histidine ammonia-lyase [Phycisphaeraceae bacterium]